MSAPLDFSCYFDTAVNNLPGIVEIAKDRLEGLEFDTLVGTGFSGGVVIPMLAAELGKSFVLIRKEGDDSHHGGGRLVGNLGERWIFVDDFISSGDTRQRVLTKIEDAVRHHWRNSGNPRRSWDGKILEEAVPLIATYVGDYLYKEELLRLACAEPNCNEIRSPIYADLTRCYDHQEEIF